MAGGFRLLASSFRSLGHYEQCGCVYYLHRVASAVEL